MDKTGNGMSPGSCPPSEATFTEIRRLYEALVPSKERLLQSLVHTEYLMPEQSKVLHFLKAYIGSTLVEIDICKGYVLYFYYVELCFSYALVKIAYVITILSAKLHSPVYVNVMLRLCQIYLKIT